MILHVYVIFKPFNNFATTKNTKTGETKFHSNAQIRIMFKKASNNALKYTQHKK